MEHIGHWALPGAALALVVIVGILIVALDDIVVAVMRPRRMKAEPTQAPSSENVAQSRRERLKRRITRLFKQRNDVRTSTMSTASRHRG